MANYLAGISNLASTVGSAVNSGSVGGAIGAALSALGGGIGGGSKPRALHTEYASGGANWQKPYGSGTDIVFYLVRADKGAGGASSAPGGPMGSAMFSPGTQKILGSEAWSSDLGMNYTEGFEAVGPTFGAEAQTGLQNFKIGVQSPLNQVATGVNVGQLTSQTGLSGGLAGPLTGLTTAQSVDVGALSQTFARFGNSQANILNSLQSVDSLESIRLSASSSEKFFHDVLKKSFNPDSLTGGVKNASQILSSFDSGAMSDLAVKLAAASGGVTTSKQLIEGINKGIIGFTSSASGAEADRVGPQGSSRERLAK